MQGWTKYDQKNLLQKFLFRAGGSTDGLKCLAEQKVFVLTSCRLRV